MGAYEGRHALIFAAAPETDYSYIRAFLGEHPDALIACADGGLRHARALGLHPDFMISDCDSMPETEGDEVIRLKPEKDVIRHYDVSGKVCPKYFVEDPEAWEQFLEDVSSAAARRLSCVRPADASTICSQISRCSRRRERWEGD